jgi:hypothetical protein
MNLIKPHIWIMFNHHLEFNAVFLNRQKAREWKKKTAIKEHWIGPIKYIQAK